MHSQIGVEPTTASRSILQVIEPPPMGLTHSWCPDLIYKWQCDGIVRYTYSTSVFRKTSRCAGVTVEGRKMGQSSEVPSLVLTIPSIEKAEAKKLLCQMRACLDTL